MTVYTVYVDGYHYQSLGHGSWTKSSTDSATRFYSRDEAERIAEILRKCGYDTEVEEDEE